MSRWCDGTIEQEMSSLAVSSQEGLLGVVTYSGAAQGEVGSKFWVWAKERSASHIWLSYQVFCQDGSVVSANHYEAKNGNLMGLCLACHGGGPL